MVFRKKNWIPGFTNAYMWGFMLNLYREDRIYSDKLFECYSLSKDGPGHKEDDLWENFSERFIRMYPGYELKNDMTIKASQSTKTVKLTELEDMLRSKDEK